MKKAISLSLFCLLFTCVQILPAWARSVVNPETTYESIDKEGVFGFADNNFYPKRNWGYIDQSGKIVIAPQFDRAGYFSKGQARISQNSKLFTIDKSGNVSGSSDSMHTRIELPCDDNADRKLASDIIARKNKNKKWDVIANNCNRQGSVKISGLDNVLWYEDNGLAPAKLHGKWGYIDGNGKFVIAPQFDDAWPFFQGLACVGEDRKYGFIKTDGKMVISSQFSSPSRFSDGMAPVEIPLTENDIEEYFREYSDSQCFFVNREGKNAFAQHFAAAHPFSQGLAAARVGAKWGYIDTAGHWKIKAIYEKARDFATGLAPVRMDQHWGFVNRSGKMIVPAIYLTAGTFVDGFAPVIDKDRGLEFLDRNGKIVPGVSEPSQKNDSISLSGDYTWRQRLMHGNLEEDDAELEVLNPNAQYEREGAYGPGLPSLTEYCPSAALAWNKDHGITEAEKLVMSGKVHRQSEGLISVYDNDHRLWGFVDEAGNNVIKPQFEWAGDFHEGLARVLISRPFLWFGQMTWGFVDKTGKVKFELPSEVVGSFHDGFALVNDKAKLNFDDYVKEWRKILKWFVLNIELFLNEYLCRDGE